MVFCAGRVKCYEWKGVSPEFCESLCEVVAYFVKLFRPAVGRNYFDVVSLKSI